VGEGEGEGERDLNKPVFPTMDGGMSWLLAGEEGERMPGVLRSDVYSMLSARAVAIILVKKDLAGWSGDP
jgi:hypothetical protein